MDEIESFYEDVQKAMKLLKKQDVKITMRDFNAKVGRERVDNTVGLFGIGEMNEKGEKLVEWCTEQNFKIMNTWFKSHPRRYWT